MPNQPNSLGKPKFEVVFICFLYLSIVFRMLGRFALRTWLRHMMSVIEAKIVQFWQIISCLSELVLGVDDNSSSFPTGWIQLQFE